MRGLFNTPNLYNKNNSLEDDMNEIWASNNNIEHTDIMNILYIAMLYLNS